MNDIIVVQRGRQSAEDVQGVPGYIHMTMETRYICCSFFSALESLKLSVINVCNMYRDGEGEHLSHLVT